LWSFGQLVAYRTWQRFREKSRKRQFPTHLVRQLEELTGSPTAVELGVSSDGRLLQRVKSGWMDRVSGQEVISEALAFDEVFDPFQLGEGRVPGLLQPSPRSQVRPDILGGTPILESHRIAVRALAEVARKQGEEAVRSAYPSLSESDIQDALRVGSGILART
jgi:uncharacterized protein (DUF433 family)